MTWRESAACRGMDVNLFLPTRGQDDRPAKAVCARCPVADPCLEEGMESRFVIGIWGGTSERERRRIRYKRTARKVA